MVKTTDIHPVRERLAVLFETDQDYWRGFVGRLYGLRSDVFHGEEWEVSEERLRGVEYLARVLLSSRLLGKVSDDSKQALLEAADAAGGR